MAITLDGTNGVTTPDVEVSSGGSASAPAITVTGDTNTGIFFPAADTIAFAEGGAEAMRIDSSGNVGIGTTTPLITSANRKVVTLNGTTDAMYNIGVNGTYTGFFYSSASNVQLGAATNIPLQLYTNDTERARITSGGALLVGTTTAAATAKVEAYKTGTVTCFLATQGDAGEYCYTSRAANNSGTYYHFNFTEAGTQRGSITSNGSATAYNTGSDYRLKDNIAPLTGALATVLQLQPRVWTWRTNGSDGQGFIAHELQEVVPDCVTGEKDAVDANGNPIYQGVDTSFLVATLTAAIQELKAINDAQASRIETLEAKVAALEANNV